MAGLYVTFIVIHSYFPKNISTLPSKSWSLIDEGIPITSTVSRREYWALTQHYLSVSNALPISFEFTFFVTAKYASSFLKYPSRYFTSVVTFVICEAKLASVCSTSCTSSDLLSLVSTSSNNRHVALFTELKKDLLLKRQFG